jgi:hypothetical protein
MEEEQSTLLSCSPSGSFTWGKRRSPTKRYGPEEVGPGGRDGPGEKEEKQAAGWGRGKGPGGCGLGRLGFGFFFYFLFQNCFEILFETCSYKS